MRITGEGQGRFSPSRKEKKSLASDRENDAGWKLVPVARVDGSSAARYTVSDVTR